MRHEETKLQIRIVTLYSYILRKDVLFWHTPNGGKRTKREAGKLKAMGVLPGVPDLILMSKAGPVFVEVKIEGGSLTDAQKDFRDNVIAMGWSFRTVTSLEDARRVALDFGLTNAVPF